jgi:MFS family permease
MREVRKAQRSIALLPPGLHLGIGSAAMIVVAFMAAAFTDPGSVQRLLVMALAMAAGAALIPDWRYSAGLGLIGYLLYVGFLVNEYGELTWDGHGSLWDLGVFTVGFVLGLAQRWWRREAPTLQDRPHVPEAEITGSSR